MKVSTLLEETRKPKTFDPNGKYKIGILVFPCVSISMLNGWSPINSHDHPTPPAALGIAVTIMTENDITVTNHIEVIANNYSGGWESNRSPKYSTHKELYTRLKRSQFKALIFETNLPVKLVQSSNFIPAIYKLISTRIELLEGAYPAALYIDREGIVTDTRVKSKFELSKFSSDTFKRRLEWSLLDDVRTDFLINLGLRR